MQNFFYTYHIKIMIFKVLKTFYYLKFQKS